MRVMIRQETLCAPGGSTFFFTARDLILYIRTYLFYVNIYNTEYICTCVPRMHICMPTSDHRVGVINSPRTSHSLSAVGVNAVAEAALPVALRGIGRGWARSSQGVLTRSGIAAGRKWMQTRLVQTSLSERVVRGAGRTGIGAGNRFAEIDENAGSRGITEKRWRPLSPTSFD